MPEFSDLVLNWYEKNARVLPWRGHPDSYAVWVSEIMLQQTRVETVIPYFERWMRKFPTIEALAGADLQEVLAAWEGLGYYSRARSLQRAAGIIMREHGGKLPRDPHQLRKLPGIGRYTAAAIASIAFGLDEATLDGNLRRVFARVFDISTPADSPAGEEILWNLARTHLPSGRAGDYNQALMDLGAGICLPRRPRCLICPLREICLSRGAPETRPVLKPGSAVPHRLKMAAVVILDGRALLHRRPSRGLLGGLWEFPAVEVNEFSSAALVEMAAKDYGLAVRPLDSLGEIRHAYTHFTLTEAAWRCDPAGEIEDPSLVWVLLSELGNYPMGKVDRAISRKIAPVN